MSEGKVNAFQSIRGDLRISVELRVTDPRESGFTSVIGMASPPPQPVS
jgi:hypothetical protein